MIYTNANYSYSGKRRKTRKPKGEVYSKYQKPAFRPLEAPLYAHRSSETQYRSVTDISSHTARQEPLQYTGQRRLIGIATMHKSNAVPVFEREEAMEIAKMRRS